MYFEERILVQQPDVADRVPQVKLLHARQSFRRVQLAKLLVRQLVLGEKGDRRPFTHDRKPALLLLCDLEVRPGQFLEKLRLVGIERFEPFRGGEWFDSSLPAGERHVPEVAHLCGGVLCEKHLNSGEQVCMGKAPLPKLRVGRVN